MESVMQVTSCSGNEALPLSAEGPHALALAHVFDEIVADAYRAHLGRLTWFGPEATMPYLVQRAQLTRIAPSNLCGLIAINQLPSEYPGVSRLYWIQTGPPAGVLPRDWRQVAHIQALSGRVRQWGVVIRLAGMLGRIDWVDAAFANMRRQFSQPGFGGARYRVSIWVREGGTDE